LQKEKKNLVATTQASREGLRRANQATAKLLQNLATLARPGVTTGDLNDYAMDYIAQLGAVPVFATEEGFPGCINTSVNDVAVHGVPGKQKLKIGDVLSIDAGMLLDGYAGDSTITRCLPQVPLEPALIAAFDFARPPAFFAPALRAGFLLIRFCSSVRASTPTSSAIQSICSALWPGPGCYTRRLAGHKALSVIRENV